VSRVAHPEDDEILEAIPVGTGLGEGAGLLIGWIIAIVAVIALGWFAWTRVINPDNGTAVERFVGGGGETYTSNDGGFTAAFPSKPTVKSERDSDGTAHVVTSQPSPDWRFTITWRKTDTDALADPTTSLNTAAGQLVSGAGGTIEEQEQVVAFQGLAVKDLAYKRGSTWYRTRIVFSLDRSYVVQAVSRKTDRKPFERLANGFRLLAAR
jgi:hypothetical protein